MAVKYKNYIKKMYTEYQELFDEFDGIHATYTLDKPGNQAKYNTKGKEIMKVVEEWENRLCSKMEKGKNSTFSHRLADKFKEELRIRYPLIDFIGVTIQKPTRPPLPTPPPTKKPPQRIEDELNIPRIVFS